jgi:predicted metal-dependent hydrolase
MLAKSIIDHPVWGRIVVTRNPRARRMTMRARPDAIHMTVPLSATHNDMEKALEQCGPKLLQCRQERQPIVIDSVYRIERENFSFGIELYNGDKFTLRCKGRCATLVCPEKTDFADSRMQEWIRKVIRRAMTRAAKSLLPQRLDVLAAKHGFTYNHCTLRDVHTRWGSCSNRGNINLSIYLMLLPDELIDYVMLHELCHTVEMNHSDRFWALMDKVTAPARAKVLRARLKGYNTDI